jgi:DGQHR domain-containing protein
MKFEKEISINCFQVKQPIGAFYIGIMQASDLVRLSYTDVRRLEEQKGEIEIYTGIQRRLSPARTKEIRKYVNLVDATFPSSVILHAKEKDVHYEKDNQRMIIKDAPDVLQVLDGQHRIKGLEEFQGEEFEINITLFVEMELEDQAIIFATLNKTQTKVNKSLVADLFEFAKYRSPQKTAHSIARALNEKEGSPFYGKIKILGTANDAEKETITQATFVEALIDYMSADPVSDRDIYKRNKIPAYATGKELERRFLRNFFLDERDTDIAQLLWNYFAAVSERWPRAWNEVRVDMILNKSTGFAALMKFLRPAYMNVKNGKEIPSRQDFKSLFDKILLTDDAFTKQTYLPGGGGISLLYRTFVEQADVQS